jgi:hypothetical protein
MQTVTHKVGATFEMSVSIDADITDWVVESQVRRLDGTLLDTLVFTLVNTAPEVSNFTFTKPNTTAWPEGSYLCDIRYTEPSGKVTATESFQINVVRRITQ